ncbi:MAG TPA: MauE/DoxX family redox-associated membrane protein [Pyrinomonadaceae bacterium]|nr:MauE/DoxX family redox-associated membrane protein [Pyrinomonadaceae bacterium]
MRDEVSSGVGREAYVDAAEDRAVTQRPASSSSLTPHPSSLLSWLVHISRFGLAALWLFAAGAKLYMRNDPAESFFTNMPFLVGERWAMTIAVAVICAEILAALLLLWPRTARLGGIWSAVMLTGFAGYALYYRYGLGNAEGLECGCFGRIFGSQLGVSTALRNLLLLIPAALVIFGIKNAKLKMQK